MNQYESQIRKKGYAIYLMVAVIAVLLVINFVLLYKNSQVISYNVKMQEDTERIKVYTESILRNLHQTDMGLRGYALIQSQQQYNVLHTGYINKDTIFNYLERTLERQKYPMADFYYVKDSLNIYYDTLYKMEQLVNVNQLAEFKDMLRNDYGYFAWLTYEGFAKRIHVFEDAIGQKAADRYALALRNSYLLQVLIFFLTVPTLLYTTFSTVRSMRDSEKIRLAEKEKNEILLTQKKTLERMVHERTNEILAQNEEIAAQNEEIVSHNDQLRLQQDEIELRHLEMMSQHVALQSAQKIIEAQNNIIQNKNIELEQEVEKQTHDLKKANEELIAHNSRLEQFTYILSHNLRAPLARVIGLSTVLEFAKTEEEKASTIQFILKSTSELDNVIRDLSEILAIQKLNTQVFKKIDLPRLLEKVMEVLGDDIMDTHAKIVADWEVKTLYSLPQYVESILHNLISNSIKYRHPERLPMITVTTKQKSEGIEICVSDNGLGIDLEKHKLSVFNLYKRFHFHVEGKGLGLYLVRTQVESLGGKISVASELEVGTTFTILFTE